MNHLLPDAGVFPMHCSANVGEPTETWRSSSACRARGRRPSPPTRRAASSGTTSTAGATTGVFNFEGGCYAKTIRLSPEGEPEIYQATRMFGTIIENVVLDEDTREIDYDDGTITENTRASYPIHYIPNAVLPSRGGHPRNVVFLTADAFGVLPPISRLTPEQAMYHFLSGYTAKVAGTERGVTEPVATFSACFGAPFLPRHPGVYAEMLGDKLREHDAKVWLVNTGWSGGGYGAGSRMKLGYTRAMVNAALAGELDDAEYATDPVFGLSVPTSVDGCPDTVLDSARAPGRTGRRTTRPPRSSRTCSRPTSRSSRTRSPTRSGRRVRARDRSRPPGPTGIDRDPVSERPGRPTGASAFVRHADGVRRCAVQPGRGSWHTPRGAWPRAGQPVRPSRCSQNAAPAPAKRTAAASVMRVKAPFIAGIPPPRIPSTPPSMISQAKYPATTEAAPKFPTARSWRVPSCRNGHERGGRERSHDPDGDVLPVEHVRQERARREYLPQDLRPNACGDLCPCRHPRLPESVASVHDMPRDGPCSLFLSRVWRRPNVAVDEHRPHPTARTGSPASDADGRRPGRPACRARRRLRNRSATRSGARWRPCTSRKRRRWGGSSR